MSKKYLCKIMKTFLIFGFSILVVWCILQTSAVAIAQEAKDNCEISSLKLDMVRNIFNSKNSKQTLILIAKLGKKENKVFLSKRRLYAVKEYLITMGVQREKIVTAQTDESEGLGSIEIYIEGQINEIIFAGFNADIPVGSCDNDKEDRERYQLRNRKRFRVIN